MHNMKADCDLTNQKYLFKKYFISVICHGEKAAFCFSVSQYNTVCLSLSALLVQSGYMKTLGQAVPKQMPQIRKR